MALDFSHLTFFSYLSPLCALVFLALGKTTSSLYFYLAALFLLFSFCEVYFKIIQREHTILKNFGLVGSLRYVIESIGPEFRQYLYMSDTEERPFTRVDRAEVYRKSKGIDSSASFGSQLNFDESEYKIRHSMFPVEKKDIAPYSLIFGEERGIQQTYTITKPMIISGMSFGALGARAVRALARGAKSAGIPMNTGEGGYPKYHLMEGCDLIFQMGTAKFGVREEDGSLSEKKLKEIAALPEVKMIEIKLSQGAKPGKGGILPKEKITAEIAQLRGVPRGKDVISPPRHTECKDVESTVRFIKKIQDLSKLPVGIKLCLGKEKEFLKLLKEMKKQKSFPDYISIDGSEGGTGAAPKSFMDRVGLPLFPALMKVEEMLQKEKIRHKTKLLCSGKLINPGRQLMALSMGADAVCTARGFMLSIGCIQALKCNSNTCPAGITTHDNNLQRGLDIASKSRHVANYVNNLEKEFLELLAASGCTSAKHLSLNEIYIPEKHPSL